MPAEPPTSLVERWLLPPTPGPIAGPAAWTGPRIAQDTDWLTELTDMDLDEIDKAIRTHFARGRVPDQGQHRQLIYVTLPGCMSLAQR